MTPLALAMAPTHGAVDKGHGAAGDEDPAQTLAVAKVGGGVDGQSHENIAGAVDGHEAVDHFLVGGRGGRFEFKEGEGVARPDDGVDAEAHEDGGEHAGGHFEGGHLGEGGGGHCVFWCEKRRVSVRCCGDGYLGWGF